MIDTRQASLLADALDALAVASENLIKIAELMQQEHADREASRQAHPSTKQPPTLKLVDMPWPSYGNCVTPISQDESDDR